MSDKYKRLNSIYYIVDERGVKVPFIMNEAQRELYNNLHTFNVILKARQLGFSTFILLYLLDACLFKPNISAGVIAQGLTEAEDLFKNKVKFAYENLPPWLKEQRTASSDTARKLEFNNGSSIQVGTSLRGGTFQLLHVSEYGKIAARYPDKAIEIKTGALNTVHAGQMIFVESTAEGQQGEFYDLCMRSQRMRDEGAHLTELDPKLHFFPWYNHPKYILPDPENVSIDKQTQEYFHTLPVELTPNQKAWYIKKAEQQGEYMKREYPSTPEEAFEASMEGAIYIKQMGLVREARQITHVPHEPSIPVYTFWDLGKGADYTSIIFFQHIGKEYRFIDYHESHNEGWEFYAKLLNSKPYVYKEHVLPWDGTMKTVGKQMSTAQRDLEGLGVRPTRIVPRTKDVWADIKGQCRSVLQRCFFDKERCDQLVKHLDNYRREWDDKRGVWKDKPLHDDASHGADAFRCFAMGYSGRDQELNWYDTEAQQFAEDYDPLSFY